MVPDKDGNYTIVIYDGNYHGKTHGYGDVAEAIRRSLQRKGHFQCELGRPDIEKKDTLDALSRMLRVDYENVCGTITDVKFNDEGELITANFKPYGPRAASALNMLDLPAPLPTFSIRSAPRENPANHVPHFGYRGLTIPQPDGSLKMDRVICWDLLPE